MADEPTTPESDVIEVDLEDVIGRVLDSRGLTKDNVDKLSLLDSLPDSIQDMFKANKPPKQKDFDSDGLVSTIGSILDEKLKGINTGGTAKKKSPGPIARFLTGDTASD